MLCLTLGEFDGSSELLINLTKNKCIRYRNGKDYVQEEIVLMAAKEIITKINSGENVSAEYYWVLANLYNHINLNELKIDTIQKSIEKVRYALQKAEDPASAVKMSEAYKLMMEVFFSKKEVDMRKPGLLTEYKNIRWNEVKNYTSATNSNQK